jgi:hypothetical protein
MRSGLGAAGRIGVRSLVLRVTVFNVGIVTIRDIVGVAIVACVAVDVRAGFVSVIHAVCVIAFGQHIFAICNANVSNVGRLCTASVPSSFKSSLGGGLLDSTKAVAGSSLGSSAGASGTAGC